MLKNNYTFKKKTNKNPKLNITQQKKPLQNNKLNIK